MKNILIINTKRHGDIFQAANLSSALLKRNPQDKISFLIFDEFQKSAKTVSNIENIFTIPRKKIISYIKNDIYNDGMALDSISKALGPVVNNNWDEIINYSNDKVSTYLASFISKISNSPVKGISFTNGQIIQYSSSWSIILNDVITSFSETPFTLNDITHLLNDIPTSNTANKIKTNPKHNETAFNNFKKLRSAHQAQGNSCKIIGIQIKASNTYKELSSKVLKELIHYLVRDEKIIPILLVSPDKSEKEAASLINQSFDNKLISVESDFIALPSVLSNLDVLITPDTSVKHMADLIKTPCLELSLGPSPIFKQGSSNPKSLILSVIPSLREFDQVNFDQERAVLLNNLISAKDIYESLQYMFGNIDLKNLELPEELCLYRPVEDHAGTFFYQITGNNPSHHEFLRLFSRYFLLNLIDEYSSEDYFLAIKELDTEQNLKIITKAQKESLGNLAKTLLSVLRSLIQTQENPAKAAQFVTQLDELLESCEENSLAGMLTLIFRAEIESLTSTEMQENFKEVEASLYALKKNIQKSIGIIKEFEEFSLNEKKKKAVEKMKSSKEFNLKSNSNEK
jgi:ADP-heptose:LPS heptosyltransferase